MRRDTFLKTLAALAATGALPMAAHAAGPNVKMMLPANPGGGWDTTGRALGKSLIESGAASTGGRTAAVSTGGRLRHLHL